MSKNILLIPSLTLPIPSVKGGAVEQLITYLLEKNEEYDKARLIVISKYDSEAINIKYKNSTVYYFDAQNNKQIGLPYFNISYFFYRLFCKVFCNKIAKKVLRFEYEPLGKYHYFCKYVAKKENVDAISIEGQWEEPFVYLNKLVGIENLYAHLHAVRDENISLRKLLPNSISISKYVHDQWVRDKTILGKNHVLLNAANIAAFDISITYEEREERRQKFGVKQNELLLLFCGRMVPIKGIRELLKAFALLTDLPVKFMLIGSDSFGNSTNTDFEIEIKQQISYNNKIISLGFVPNHELPSIYAMADIQVIPSICQEGAGLVAIEGMAAGLPLITTISGGMVEYLDEESAIQLPIDDDLPQNIADAVIDLYNNPDKRKAMGRAGKLRAKLFSKDNYYNNFIKILDD